MIPMQHYTYTIVAQTRQPARCPICQDNLPDENPAIYSSMVLCPSCRTHTPSHILSAALQHAFKPDAPQYWSISAGLLWYTPPAYRPRKHAAHVVDLLTQARPTPCAQTEHPEKNEVETPQRSPRDTKREEKTGKTEGAQKKTSPGRHGQPDYPPDLPEERPDTQQHTDIPNPPPDQPKSTPEPDYVPDPTNPQLDFGFLEANNNLAHDDA